MLTRGLNVKKGDVFGRLTALDDDEVVNGRRFVLCKCECGTERLFRTDRLINGITKGCGCNKSPKTDNLYGKKFGHLTIIGKAESKKVKYVKCKCDCGNIVEKKQFEVLNGKRTTCGKCNYRQLEIGDTFGRWKIIGESRINNEHREWLCQCSCEKHSIRYVYENSLKSGRSTNCGCDALQKRIESRYIHGQSGTRLYRIWNGMLDRCYKSHHDCYKYYGGRGIKICDEWKNDFFAFKEWALNNGYSDDLTIDRIDVNGNYEPSNCRWATRVEQANNTRKTVYITYKGETHSIGEWSEITRLKHSLIYSRYSKGYSPELIFNKDKIKEGFS